VDQTQTEFLVNLEQLVDQLFTDLDELRIKRNHGPSRRQLIDSIFRSVHTVKGSAASAGLDATSELANEFENLLEKLREGQTKISDDLLEACEIAADTLAENINDAASGELVSSEQGVIKRLRAAAEDTKQPTYINDEALLDLIAPALLQRLTASEKQRLAGAVAEGCNVFVVTSSFRITDFEEQFSKLKQTLTQRGELLATSPTVEEASPEKVNFRVLYATNESSQALAAALEGIDANIEDVKSVRTVRASERDSQSSMSSASGRSNVVHADLDKIDRLISATHDLFLKTTKTLDLASFQATSDTNAIQKLRGLQDEIRTSFMSIQDELINLRMVSLGPTLQRAARAGRAAARLAQKDINFEVLGRDITIDKLLAEGISDSIIHLVRNAVDHGVEAADERARSGKPSRATVRIEAASEGTQSRVRVIDDGRGINPENIKAAAKRLRIEAGASDLDLERSLRLIFRPGFTTLTSASDLSGRGVGLDVVETAVEQVGGELRVSSEPGRGTTFEIRLPVTFGLLNATVIVAGERRYCLPTSQVVAFNGNAESRDAVTVSVQELLGQGSPASTALGQPLITCQFPAAQDEGSYAVKAINLAVDAVEGTQEVLVRNLGRHAGRWYGVAGATELRDGSVALVLDLPRLYSGYTRAQ
jgi:two-component system chemotaxis sensor kinase CheA